MAFNIESFIRNLPPGVTPDTVIPGGPHAGKTIGQVLQERMNEQQAWGNFYGGFQNQDMTVDQALEMAVNSPNPDSFQIPYGPFQGMGVKQLVALKQQQTEALQDAGVLEKPPEEPGYADMAISAGLPVAQAAGTYYLMDAIKNAGTTGAAAASAPAGPAAALGGAPAGAGAAAPSFQLGGSAGGLGGVPGPAGAAPGMPSVVGAQALGLHNYGMLGLNSTVPGLAGAGLTAAGLAAGAAVGSRQLSGGKKLLEGEDPSWLEHAALFPLTGGFSLASKALGLGESGRHEGVYQRESMRNDLRDAGIYDGNNIKLAGGQMFDIGSNRNTDMGNIDWSGDVQGDRVAEIDALVRAMQRTGGDERAWQTGELYNAATSGGDARANVQEIFKNSGMTPEQIKAAIQADPEATPDEKRVWTAAVDRATGYSPTAAAAPSALQQPNLTAPPTEQPIDRNPGRPAPEFNTAERLGRLLDGTQPEPTLPQPKMSGGFKNAFSSAGQSLFGGAPKGSPKLQPKNALLPQAGKPKAPAPKQQGGGINPAWAWLFQ